MPNETIKHIATVFPIPAEALKPDPKLRRRVSIIKDFGLNTSTHGIPGIARSQSVANRVFWIVSLLIFTGIMIFFVVQAIRAYFEYPSQISITVITEWPQAFPAVTICNYSPLRFDRFIRPFLNYTNMMNLTNITDPANFTSEQVPYIRDFLIYKLNQNESLTDFYYTLDVMMMSCAYNAMPCTVANFTTFSSPFYGMCYTFNAKLKDAINDGVRYNADNGGTGLFELRLYSQQHQYVPYMSYASGMVAVVHDNGQAPDIELSGMYLSPGQHHRLSYRKKTSSFLSSPYSDCTANVNLGMRTMLDEYHGTNYEYSQYQCFQSCLQAYTFQQCGCGSPFRWVPRTIFLPGSDQAINITYCDVNNPCYTTAMINFFNKKEIWSIFCPQCTRECFTVDFTIKSSSLQAPPTFLLNDIKEFVQSSTVPLPTNWSTTWMSEIQLSYVALEVSYESTRTEINTEQATLSAVDVISNVGGQTGLWIGISFLSLMEMAEMTYRLLRRQCHSLRKAIRKRAKRRKTVEHF